MGSSLRIMVITLAIILATGPAMGTTPKTVDLIIRASEWYVTDVPDGTSEYVERFEKGCDMLDSLLVIYMPLDTLSGWIGHERIWKIAQAYTDVGMFQEAQSWWQLLDRVDQRGFYRMENYRGLLKTGVELFDASAISDLIDDVDLWDSSIKEEMGKELLDAMKLLLEKDTDLSWLYKRFQRVRRFLPPFESDLFHIQLLLTLGDYSGAVNICGEMIDRIYPRELSPSGAKRLLEELYRTSVLSGRYEAAENIIDQIKTYGSEPLFSRAESWEPGLSMMMGKMETALHQYSQICAERPDATGYCFWKDYLESYGEIIGYVQ